MAIQQINIGNIVNDGLGDDLRTAFQKVNANFADLSASLTVTASNVGGELAANVFKQKTGNNLEFNKIYGFNGIDVNETADGIQITTSRAIAFRQIQGNTGEFIATEEIQGVSLRGNGRDLSVDVDNNTGIVSINSLFPISEIFTVLDFGNLPDAITGNVSYDNTIQFNNSVANIDFGTFSNPGRIYIDLGQF